MLHFSIICHICACIFFYIGRKVPYWNLGEMNQISWMYVNPELNLDTYDRNSHVSMSKDASGFEKYVLCFYWVSINMTIYTHTLTIVAI